jgi:hypothetical protein
MLKNMVEPEGQKWRHNILHMSSMLDKQSYMHTHAHSLGHIHACAHAHAHKYVIFIAFPRQQW